ncbi:unnamed protein product, partial [Brassica oleracea]
QEVSVSKKPKQVNSRWSLFVPAKPSSPSSPRCLGV